MITRERNFQIPFIETSHQEQAEVRSGGVASVASMIAAGIILGAIAGPEVVIPVSIPLFQNLSMGGLPEITVKRQRRARPTTPEYLAAVAAEPINYCDVVDASETAIWDVTASDGLI